MTAQTLIDNLRNTTLVGIELATDNAANTATLLELLNLAKDKIAEDTLLWLNGETITMVTDTYEYTLTNMPIQVIDVFDANNMIRPRNTNDTMGYYQVSPNTLKFNSITNGLDVKVNFYDYPTDYIITDELVVPNTLLSAMKYYIAHQAFEIYKSENETFYSAEYMKKYAGAIQDYKANSDSVDVDSIESKSNKIWLRGIR